MKTLRDKALSELDKEYANLYFYLKKKLGGEIDKLNQILEIEVELTLRNAN